MADGTTPAPAKLRRIPLAAIVLGPNERPRAPGAWTWGGALAMSVEQRRAESADRWWPFDVSDLGGVIVNDGCALFMQAPAVRVVSQGRALDSDRYELIFGERRLWRALLLGASSVSVKVYDVTPEDAYVMHVVENMAHAPLPPLCEARELARLRDEHHLDVPTIAARTGKREPDVRARLALLAAIPEAQAALGAGSITVDVAAFFGRHAEDMQRAAWVAVGARVTPGEAVGLRPWVRGLFARLPLAGVAWSLDDTMRVDGGPRGSPLPPCTGCPRRSDAQAALPGLDEGAGAYCLDRACYEAKEAAVEAREAERKAAGPTLEQVREAHEAGDEIDAQRRAEDDAPASEPLPRAEPQGSAADERKAAARAAEEEERAIVRAVFERARGERAGRVALAWLAQIIPDALDFPQSVLGVDVDTADPDEIDALLLAVLAAELLTREANVAALPARWAGLGKPAKKVGAVKKGTPPCTCPPGPGRHGSTCPAGDTKRRDAQTRAQPKRELDTAAMPEPPEPADTYPWEQGGDGNPLDETTIRALAKDVGVKIDGDALPGWLSPANVWSAVKASREKLAVIAPGFRLRKTLIAEMRDSGEDAIDVALTYLVRAGEAVCSRTKRDGWAYASTAKARTLALPGGEERQQRLRQNILAACSTARTKRQIRLACKGHEAADVEAMVDALRDEKRLSEQPGGKYMAAR